MGKKLELLAGISIGMMAGAGVYFLFPLTLLDFPMALWATSTTSMLFARLVN